MDNVSDDEVIAVDAIGSTRFSSKESEYSLTPGSSNMLEYQEMIIPSEVNDLESSPGLFPDFLDGKNIDRIGASEHASTSPHCMDDSGGMVEELTLRNYNSGKAVVGASSMREKMQTRQNQWQHLYQRAGGIASGNFIGDVAYRENGGAIPNVWENGGSTFFPGFWDKKAPNESYNETSDNSPINENKSIPSSTLLSPGGIRTKILSKSGFSEYFVKNTLKGKGVICRASSRDELGVDIHGQSCPKTAGVAMVDSDVVLNTSRETTVCPHGIPEPRPVPLPDAFHDSVSLREWLKVGQNKVNKVKSLYIFKQILDLVDLSHSRGVALQDLRPSYFKLLPSNQVTYLGSPVQKEIVANVRDQESYNFENDRDEKRLLENGSYPSASQCLKKRKIGDHRNSFRRWPQFPMRSGIKSGTPYDTNAAIGGLQDLGNGYNEEHGTNRAHMIQRKYSSPHVSSASQIISTFASDPLEEKWYTSPEDLRERFCTLSSNIYCLGILLFELLGSFDSDRAHAVAMANLHHRILPPNFLSENPKEAGFCLWLLHPEPSSRPSTREILQSEVIRGIQELSGDELSSSINQEDGDSELLSHFLVTLKELKEKDATKLVKDIRCLESDIAEVEMRRKRLSTVSKCLDSRGNSSIPTLEVNLNSSPLSCLSDSRLLRNMSQLERAYFSVRSEVQLSDSDLAAPANLEILESRETCYGAQKIEERKPTDRLGAFFHDLCKYARYSKFEVRGILRNGDFNSSANVICSLSFDRDEDYFAAAGVSKKIKIYEFNALLTDSVDIHYPAIEISNKSKLSCVCWNSYIRNYLASTDYDGVVKIWDVGSGQGVSDHSEHDRRAWSVDFSQVDPTKFASGSDDCSVKLWSINEKNSLSTIGNIANVCCVQFSPYSTHLLSFGSADYKTYCYDLRNASSPLCILAGHEKAVSYVKFLDSETIVSASTDNTLKLWDLNKTNSGGLSTNACISTFTGHTNEKNFVGLSVADGYITCGSETNEVFSYHRSLPMPITSHKFGSVDPISGKETENDNNQFVSSVCWRRKSDTVVAANSTGCIKLLQMV